MASHPEADAAAGGDADSIHVEVIYAEPQRQALIRLRLPAGTTLQQAVEASGLIWKYPAIDLTKLGIYGKISKADTVLCNQDRIEIYRPLIADPAELRRKRSAARLTLDKGRRTRE